MVKSDDFYYLFKGTLEVIHRFISRADVYYVVENNPWAIMTEGKNITTNLKNKKGEIAIFHKFFPKKSFVHYGSFNKLEKATKLGRKDVSRVIGTCYHIVDGNRAYDSIPDLDKYIGKWHTSCNITSDKLKKYGIAEEKIVVIPIGVDLNVYFPESNSKRRTENRKKYGIPDGAFVIASFQKDGWGWGEGREPKMIKGPDVFCDVVEMLFKEFPNIYVLLSGPARGYVKNRLDKAGVPYHHEYMNNQDDVADLYRLSDCYIVASREEGGPKAVLESMACGVPLVTTRVGQAPDIIQNNENAIITEVEDVDALYDGVKNIILDKEFKKKLIKNGLETAPRYDIAVIAERYEKELYTE